MSRTVWTQGLRYFFLFGLFFLPLVWWPWGVIPYEIPKVWFFQRWVEGLALLSLLSAPYLLEKKKIDVWLVFFVLIFLMVAVLSSLFGVDFAKSFWGNTYRWDGLFTLFHFVGLFLFLVLFWGKSWRKQTAGALGLGCFLTSLLVLFSGFRLHVLGDISVSQWGGALGATFGQPNFLAGYFLVTLPFLAYLWVESKTHEGRILWSFALLVQVLAVFLTLSWGGMLGVLFFGMGLVFLKFRTLWRLVALATPFLLVVMLFGMMLFGWQNSQKPYTYKESVIFEHDSRLRVFTKGTLGFLKRPYFGWGWANFDYAFEAVPWPMEFTRDAYVDKGHSVLFETLVTVGVVGFLAYVVLVWKVLFGLRSGDLWSRFLLISLLLYLFHSQTNVISVSEDVVFWLAVGIVANKS